MILLKHLISMLQLQLSQPNTFDWWRISMNTIVLPIRQQRYMEQVMHTMQNCMRRQIQPVPILANMLSHDKLTNESIPKLSSSMRTKVACWQQYFGTNLELSMSSPSISILLLILLCLKQPFNCNLPYDFPMLYLVLHCLHRMNAIHAINRHL